tara:strand:+ start:19715 stop:19948 length:234 start_codon:yes stop_codon:yes gene_type:complete
LDKSENFEFAQIIANNYTADEQPMWEMYADAFDEELFSQQQKPGFIIDAITIAFIPTLGRIDILVVPEDFDYGVLDD